MDVPDYCQLLYDELHQYLDDKQIAEVKKAYLLAEEAHQSQQRQTGEPYITHPVAVATILAKMRLDTPSIIAAILHDVIEDTAVDKKTVVQLFGEEVANLVDGVTKLTQMEFSNREQAQAENFYKMVLATVKDIRVILIKLSDRLHNVRTLDGLPEAKKHRIAKETLEIYAPIANRLGMHSMRIDLEDLSFAALYPLRHLVLKHALAQARADRSQMVKQIEDVVQDSLQALHFPYVEVQGRHKHLYSLYQKMQFKKLSLEEVMDIYGFRVLVDSVDNCYRALGIIHSMYKPLPERFKDYIAIPKANGYQSLHTSLFGPYGVPIEFQIRTLEMDKMAESGIAAHWLYKSNSNVSTRAELKAKEWISGLLEMQQTTGNSMEFIENVKIDLFSDEVYVFTPNGDIVKLPYGATPIDFAYAVHSEIGDTCVAAKVDRQHVPLSTQLSNGQTVEITTLPKSRPNAAWLDFVVTGKAKTRINHFLNSQNQADIIEFGQQLLQHAVTSYLDKEAYTEEKLEEVAKKLNYPTSEQLLEAVGLGNQVPLVLARYFADNEEIFNLQSLDDETQPLLIKGTEGISVEFATCCYPIPGDPIVGYLESRKGLEIHRERCETLVRVRNSKSNRLMGVNWAKSIDRLFTAKLLVFIRDKKGALASITNIISQADTDIIDFHVIKRDGGYTEIDFLVTVRDRIQLANLIRRLKTVNDVVKIERV